MRYMRLAIVLEHFTDIFPWYELIFINIIITIYVSHILFTFDSFAVIQSLSVYTYTHLFCLDQLVKHEIYLSLHTYMKLY